MTTLRSYGPCSACRNTAILVPIESGQPVCYDCLEAMHPEPATDDDLDILKRYTVGLDGDSVTRVSVALTLDRLETISDLMSEVAKTMGTSFDKEMCDAIASSLVVTNPKSAKELEVFAVQREQVARHDLEHARDLRPHARVTLDQCRKPLTEEMAQEILDEGKTALDQAKKVLFAKLKTSSSR